MKIKAPILIRKIPKKPPDKEIPEDKDIDKYKDKLRLDKVLRKKESAFFNSSVIKYRLNKVTRDPQNIRRINQIADTLNHMSQLAFYFANYYVLSSLKYGRPIVPLNQDFYNKVCCCFGTIKDKREVNSSLPFKEEMDFFIEQFPMEYPFPERKKLGSIQNGTCAMMETATRNHLELNFEGRFKKYLKLKYDVRDQYKRGYIFRCIFNIKGDYKSKFDNNLQCLLLIQIFKKKWNNPDQESLRDQYFTLPKYFDMLKEFEKYDTKLFNLLPNKSTMVPNHIDISTSCLYDLLSLWYGGTNASYKEKGERKCWDALFKIPKHNTKWFGGRITTNGYDVSVYYKTPPKSFPYSKEEWKEKTVMERILSLDKLLEKRKKRHEQERKENKKKKGEENQDNLTEDQFDGKLSNDPGHRYLYTMEMDSGEIIRCSSRRFKYMTGQSKRLNTINRRKDEVPILKEYSRYSLKTSDPIFFISQLKEKVSRLPEVLREYNRYLYRKLGFLAKIKKKQSYSKLEKEILGDRNNILIGWGAGGTNQKGLKGSHMPNKGLKDHLSRNDKITILDVNEDLTSKMCNGCGKETGKIFHWNEILKDGVRKRRRAVLYGLRRCKNNECRKTYDRDVNATKNIRKILMCILRGEERPLYLCRKKRESKPTNDLGGDSGSGPGEFQGLPGITREGFLRVGKLLSQSK